SCTPRTRRRASPRSAASSTRSSTRTPGPPAWSSTTRRPRPPCPPSCTTAACPRRGTCPSSGATRTSSPARSPCPSPRSSPRRTAWAAWPCASSCGASRGRSGLTSRTSCGSSRPSSSTGEARGRRPGAPGPRPRPPRRPTAGADARRSSASSTDSFKEEPEMHHTRRKPVTLVTAVLGTATLALVGACSSGGAGGGQASGGDSTTYTWWDPYPQHDASSDWEARVQQCGEEAGVTIQRTAYDTTALTNQALLPAQEGTSPDVILLDNPAVSTLADTGMLTTMDEFGLDTADVDANLLDAGVVDGETYGIPIGANTLTLYYNKEILDAAGVDPASITDWASLTAALEAVTGAGHKGITFAGIGTEEGSFQFLPWFWGAGADLTQLDSPEAVEALELWKGWLDAGYAPNSVIQNSQNTTWE